MAVSRIRISKKVSEMLRSMERKTQLTPNLLARLAIAISFEQKEDLPKAAEDNAGLEFNYSTLYGEQEQLYRHLAIQYAGDRTANADACLRMHIERGVPLLQSELATKDMFDLVVA